MLLPTQCSLTSLHMVNLQCTTERPTEPDYARDNMHCIFVAWPWVSGIAICLQTALSSWKSAELHCMRLRVHVWSYMSKVLLSRS